MGRRRAQPVVVVTAAGRAPAAAPTGGEADGVTGADGEAEACAVAVEDVKGEVDGTGGRDGTPERVGTGVADAVAVGAPPSCSVQLVPSQVQVSPITSPAAEVDPSSCPPKSTTWPVEPSYARAGAERGAGAPADGASTQPAAGLVEIQRTPV